MVADTVNQIIEVRDEPTKFKRLMELITHWHPKGSILVFVDRYMTWQMHFFADILEAGYWYLWLHGGKVIYIFLRDDFHVEIMFIVFSGDIDAISSHFTIGIP